MTPLIWILMMSLVHQGCCLSPRKHKSHHGNVKKSFLADAMKEMEYGENTTTITTKESSQSSTKSATLEESNHHSNKQKATQKHSKKKQVKQDYFVARIFPSSLSAQHQNKSVQRSKEQNARTPQIDTRHSKLFFKEEKFLENKKGANSDTKTNSSRVIGPSSSLKHIIGSTINNDTGNVDKNSFVVDNNSSTASGGTDDKLNHDDGKKGNSEKNIKNAIFLLQAFVEKLIKENQTNETDKAPKQTPTLKLPEKKDVLKQAFPIHVQPENGQQSTVISGVKYNLAPVYRLKPKYSKDDVNETSKSNATSSSSPQQQLVDNPQSIAQEDIEKMKQEEKVLRQSLVEKELEIQRLKEQASSSDPNASNQAVIATANQTTHSNEETEKPNPSPSNDDNKEMKFASLKGIPPELLAKLKMLLEERRKKSQKYVSQQEVASRKAFETARKLVKAAFAREQLYKAEKDFLEKVKDMMNKTSTANLLKDNNNNAQKEGNKYGDDSSALKDYIKQIEEQNKMESKVRRTSPSPPPTKDLSNPSSAQTNSTKTDSIGHHENNSSQTGALSGLQSSAEKILKELNRTKGPEEKNVEAAAHLEEKVAEQQDELYDKLLRQTLGKGMGDNDGEDDDEDEDEEGMARNFESRPEEELPRQENYGDFQDSDEDAQNRSQVKYVKDSNNNETLPTVDEDSIFSLRDRISRPPEEVSPQREHKSS